MVDASTIMSAAANLTCGECLHMATTHLRAAAGARDVAVRNELWELARFWAQAARGKIDAG